MKKSNDFLKEYSRRLNDEDLKYLHTRLTFQLGGDLGDVVEFAQENEDVDKWMSSASTSNEIYDMIDQLGYFVGQEVKRRIAFYESKK